MPIAVMLARNTLNVIVDPSFAAGITIRTDFGSMPQTIHRCGAENTSMCGAALII
jgi:phage-related tail protein